MQTHNGLPAANCTRSPVETTPRSPRTRASHFPTIKTRSGPIRAALRCWRISSSAIDFVREAIAADTGGRALLRSANVGQDAGVVDADDKGAFIAAAKTRQWDREKSVRTLA